MAETPETNKPVLRNGYPIRDLGDGSIISGQANGEELVLGAEAMNPLPLAHFAPITVARSQKGLIVGDTVRCPWHHVCFSLRNGEALRVPASATRVVVVWRKLYRLGSCRIATHPRNSRRCSST